MCLNRYAAGHVPVLISPPCMKRIVKCVSSNTPNFRTKRPVVNEMIITGVHKVLHSSYL